MVRALIDEYPEVDVLAKNQFGKSVLTEAFGAAVPEITAMILEHKSAAALEGTKKKPEPAKPYSPPTTRIYNHTWVTECSLPSAPSHSTFQRRFGI